MGVRLSRGPHPNERNFPVKASDFLVRCLERESIRYVFEVPGKENVDLML